MFVKVCGLKYKENIIGLSLLNPDMMGFIFYEGSKRFVGHNYSMPSINSKIKKVGVFVNQELDYVAEIVNKYDLDYVQLHGRESASYCNKLKKSTGVIKAFHVKGKETLKYIDDYTSCIDYCLLDTYSPDHGGTGIKFNWSVLKYYKAEVPVILSGGIALNDAGLIKELKKLLGDEVWMKLAGVDINSRFEVEYGLKDITQVQDFLINIRTQND